MAGLSCAPQQPPNPYAGQLLFSELRTALMSVSGLSANEVFAVGADLGDGDGPNFLAFNGSSWRRVSTGLSEGDLWWISVEPISGVFYLAGAPGLIVQFDPESFTFAQMETPGTETLFGIWGTSEDNLLAVGGNLANPQSGGVLWTFTGEAWSAVDLSELFPNGTPLLYKVWGRNSSDIYVVGTQCTVLHFDGNAWSKVPCDSEQSLFTVHGNEELVVAVGGRDDGVINELTPTTIQNRTPTDLPPMNGVFVPSTGLPVAVGIRASLAVRNESGWELQTTEMNTNRDFHAAWIDPDGGIWAVGGNLGSALDDGILAYFGSRRISTNVTP